MNGILEEFLEKNNYNTTCDVDTLIRDLKEYRIDILSKQWEDYYKERCGEAYLTLREFIDAIRFQNFYALGEENYQWYKEFYELHSDVTISSLVEFCKRRGIKLSYKNTEMICKACACEGCPYLEEHLGYTCEKCKKDMLFTGYQGYCDE